MSASRRRAGLSCLAFVLAAGWVSANCAGDDDGSQMRSTAARAQTQADTTTTAPHSSTTVVPDGLPSGVKLREPDGSYPTGLPNDPTFFPIGVWLETVIDPSQVAMDRSIGLNLYVAFRLAVDHAALGSDDVAIGVLQAVEGAAGKWVVAHPDPDITDDLTYVRMFISNLEDRHTEPLTPTVVNPWPAD